MITWKFVVIVVLLAIIFFFGGSNYDARLQDIQSQLAYISNQLFELEALLLDERRHNRRQ